MSKPSSDGSHLRIFKNLLKGICVTSMFVSLSVQRRRQRAHTCHSLPELYQFQPQRFKFTDQTFTTQDDVYALFIANPNRRPTGSRPPGHSDGLQMVAAGIPYNKFGPFMVYHSGDIAARRSEEHTSELQSPKDLVCR